jgi:hypothetical protein
MFLLPVGMFCCSIDMEFERDGARACAGPLDVEIVAGILVRERAYGTVDVAARSRDRSRSRLTIEDPGRIGTRVPVELRFEYEYELEGATLT